MWWMGVDVVDVVAAAAAAAAVEHVTSWQPCATCGVRHSYTKNMFVAAAPRVKVATNLRQGAERFQGRGSSGRSGEAARRQAHAATESLAGRIKSFEGGSSVGTTAGRRRAGATKPHHFAS